MKGYRVEEARVIHARPEQVYRVVSDLNEHKQFLPKEFERVEILQGGIGAGTVINVTMNVFGTRATSTLTVEEPEPGRVLREYNNEVGVDTKWIFTPVDGGARCHLKLESDFQPRPGLAGLVERLLMPGFFRSLYRRELEQLDAHMQTKKKSA